MSDFLDRIFYSNMKPKTAMSSRMESLPVRPRPTQSKTTQMDDSYLYDGKDEFDIDEISVKETRNSMLGSKFNGENASASTLAPASESANTDQPEQLDETDQVVNEVVVDQSMPMDEIYEEGEEEASPENSYCFY